MSLPHTVTVLALAAIIALSSGATAPCHSNRRTSGDGSDCNVAIIPPKLCRECKLRPLVKRGNFKSCSQIYDLTPIGCRQQLRRYARLNPCDKVRNKQVKDFGKNLNRMGLDYFVYSVCEECCDCVPRGTKKGEYNKRKAAGTLIKVDRANCATHANFDVCKVMPKVRYIKRTPSEPTPSNLNAKWPEICPIIRKWKAGPNGQGTFNKDEVEIPNSMRRFLTRYTTSIRCRNRTFWNECVALETAQRRL